MKYIKKLKPFHIDLRGEMTHLLDEKFKIKAVLLITCKKGAIRANHYHKKDTHHSYMLKGKMEYTYQNLNSKNKNKKTITVNVGELVITPPMTAHAMKFLEDSVILALTTEPREQKKYEKDTVRVEVI